MKPAAVVAFLTTLAGCSIDFVALDEGPIDTLLQVTSDHTDSVRVAVQIRHRGSFVESVSVNDERMFTIPSGSTRELIFDFDLTVDPAEPVLDIRVDHHPGASRPLELRVPLLVRAGEATCSSSGALTLPFELDESGAVGFDTFWLVDLLDAGGRVVASIRSEGDLPQPVTVTEELVDEVVTTARLSVRITGPVEDAPYNAFLVATTGTEWTVAGLCP